MKLSLYAEKPFSHTLKKGVAIIIMILPMLAR